MSCQCNHESGGHEQSAGPSHDSPDSGPQDNLFTCIDRSNVVALNAGEGRGPEVIKPWHERNDMSQARQTLSYGLCTMLFNTMNSSWFLTKTARCMLIFCLTLIPATSDLVSTKDHSYSLHCFRQRACSSAQNRCSRAYPGESIIGQDALPLFITILSLVRTSVSERRQSRF
jgi:hypothetical protein